MNQHKDILYRQKYATYQLNNRTFSTQNTKISARSLAISYICFQVRIGKKREKKATLSTTTENLVTPARTPAPDKGSIREIATGEITVSITPDDHLEGPYLLKTRELPGAPPPGPPAGALPLHSVMGPTAAPGRPHPYEARADARAVRYAHGFSAHPFLQIMGPPLYTSPFARPSRLPPEASILGGGGGGGAGGSHPKHIVLPPPPPQ